LSAPSPWPASYSQPSHWADCATAPAHRRTRAARTAARPRSTARKPRTPRTNTDDPPPRDPPLPTRNRPSRRRPFRSHTGPRAPGWLRCPHQRGTDTGAASKGSTATGQYTFTAHTGAGTTSIPADKPAVLLFFTVECGGCGPTANALADARAADPAAADYALVDVAGYETPADIEQFIADNDATGLGWAIDKNGALTKAYGITQLSTVAIVTPDGQVTYRGVEPDADTIRAELAKATR